MTGHAAIRNPIFIRVCSTGAFLCWSVGQSFALTNTISAADVPAPLPDMGGSVIRLIGALLFVVGLFLVGAMAFRRWQRQSRSPATGPKLVIVDIQPLGARQSLYVVAYDRQRFLLGVSPSGMSLLSHLPETTASPESPAAPVTFVAALQQVIQRKTS
jgi:flagellar biogenesis protein FliO